MMLDAALVRPRWTAAALVALVGAVAIAVELLVPAPRPPPTIRRTCAAWNGCTPTFVVGSELPPFSRPPPSLDQ